MREWVDGQFSDLRLALYLLLQSGMFAVAQMLLPMLISSAAAGFTFWRWTKRATSGAVLAMGVAIAAASAAVAAFGDEAPFISVMVTVLLLLGSLGATAPRGRRIRIRSLSGDEPAVRDDRVLSMASTAGNVAVLCIILE